MHICYLVILSHQFIPIFWQPQLFIWSNIRFLSIGYSFFETLKNFEVCGCKKLGCHTGQEEVSGCQTRGESGIYCTQVTKHASQDPTWLPRQMLPSVQNRGKSDPTESTDVLQKCLKMLRSACKLHLTRFLLSSSHELPGLFQYSCYFSLTFSPGSKMHIYCIHHFKLSYQIKLKTAWK